MNVVIACCSKMVCFIQYLFIYNISHNPINICHNLPELLLNPTDASSIGWIQEQFLPITVCLYIKIYDNTCFIIQLSCMRSMIHVLLSDMNKSGWQPWTSILNPRPLHKMIDNQYSPNVWIKNRHFSFKKTHFKMSVKWWPFYLGLNVLIRITARSCNSLQVDTCTFILSFLILLKTWARPFHIPSSTSHAENQVLLYNLCQKFPCRELSYHREVADFQTHLIKSTWSTLWSV